MHPKEASRDYDDQNEGNPNKARLLANKNEAPECQRNYCELRHGGEQKEMLPLYHGMSCDNLGRTVHSADIQTDRRSKHDDRDEPKHCSTECDLR
jgi:hypothetical protein